MPSPPTRGLSARLDALNVAIERAEAALSQINLCVEADIPLDSSVPEAGALGYGKIGSNWRLYIKSSQGKIQPLTNTPQQLRLLAAYRLDNLLDELVGVNDNRIQAVEGAIKKFETFAAAILTAEST